MTEYQKINTLFKRDANNIIIPSQFTCEEFSYLKDCKFEATEKVDGTNVRIEFTRGWDKWQVKFKGRTDSANMPKHLEDRLHELFDGRSADLDIIFPGLPDKVVLYGEGYGAKIQKGGNYISNGVNFILFDVKIGDWWLKREDCERIATALNIKIVPIIGYMTITEAIEYVKKGFKSTIAENKDYDAEGLVLKTPCGLKFSNGERVILKIKTCDFVKFKAKYGDEESPMQPTNTKYEQ